MDNTKATAIIKRLEKLIKYVQQSGIMQEKISYKQYLTIEALTYRIEKATREIDRAPIMRLDRLKLLVEHLKATKLQTTFNFSESTYQAEYAILFPEAWKMSVSKIGLPTAIYTELDCNVVDFDRYGEEIFFGLTCIQHSHLFYYYNQNPEWGNIKMTGRTGKAKFIENMEQFIAFFEKGGRQC